LIGTLGVQMPSVVKELVNRHPGKIALRRERMAGPVKPSCCMPSRSGKALGRLRRSKPDDEKDGGTKPLRGNGTLGRRSASRSASSFV
jgi:hypothetical protein